MTKTLLGVIGWIVGLLILALACWLLGVFLGWPLWKPVALFVGIIVALLILAWLRRRWQAWRLRRRLARPAAATAESTARLDADWRAKSEEHTSELQSLMRISYAVFCLKKKKNKKQER